MKIFAKPILDGVLSGEKLSDLILNNIYILIFDLYFKIKKNFLLLDICYFRYHMKSRKIFIIKELL